MNSEMRFRRDERLLESLWAIPALGAVIGGVSGALAAWAEERWSTPSLWQYTPSTASAVLAAIVGATAALTGFVVTVTVLVVQMAIGTFSARIMRLWYRDRLLKVTLAVLIGTLTYSFALLWRIDDDFVPNLGVTLAGLLVCVSLLVFVVYFDRSIRRLRPVAVAADVAETARSTFTETTLLAERTDVRWQAETRGATPSLVVRAGRGGAIQAVDLDGLVNWARAHGAEVVVTHPVGDFVHAGTTVLQVYGDGVTAGDERALAGLVALGEERTFDQDPAFAIRIMVDIANKALSPAVNDPTTAVQVIDHIGEVLTFIGATDLARLTRQASDAAPAAVVMATRPWEDFLVLGLTEIREFGITSVQVVRRLRSLLHDLEGSVRPEHRAAVLEELRRLDSMVDQQWSTSVDMDRARRADRQGIGGPAGQP